MFIGKFSKVYKPFKSSCFIQCLSLADTHDIATSPTPHPQLLLACKASIIALFDLYFSISPFPLLGDNSLNWIDRLYMFYVWGFSLSGIVVLFPQRNKFPFNHLQLSRIRLLVLCKHLEDFPPLPWFSRWRMVLTKWIVVLCRWSLSWSDIKRNLILTFYYLIL